eukprot:SAG31_NODE_679_length_12887_cov_3.259540_12_plen_110_part_00
MWIVPKTVNLHLLRKYPKLTPKYTRQGRAAGPGVPVRTVQHVFLKCIQIRCVHGCTRVRTYSVLRSTRAARAGTGTRLAYYLNLVPVSRAARTCTRTGSTQVPIRVPQV